MGESSSKESRDPTCPTCLASLETPRPKQGRIGPIVLDRTAVSSVSQGPDGFTHRVKRIIKNYELAVAIACSFPDRTPHHRGTLIEAFCDRKINIGHECARLWCHGIDEAKKEASDEEAHARAAAAIEAAKSELPKEIERLRRDTGVVLDFKGECRRLAPHFEESMRDRFRQGARGREVDVGQGAEHVTGLLNGLEFWSSTPGLTPSEITQHADTALARTKLPEPLTASQAKWIARELGRVADMIRERREWLEKCSAFLAPANLTLALAAADMSGWRVVDGWMTDGKVAIATRETGS